MKLKTITVILLFLFSSCYYTYSPEKLKYYIPEGLNFIDFNVATFKPNDDTFNIDTFSRTKTFDFDISKNFKGTEIYYQTITAKYTLNEEKIFLIETYNEDNQLIKENLKLEYINNLCVCTQHENSIYIGDYQIDDIIFKDVVLFQECGCIKNVYANYKLGLLSFTRSNNITYTINNFNYKNLNL